MLVSDVQQNDFSMEKSFNIFSTHFTHLLEKPYDLILINYDFCDLYSKGSHVCDTRNFWSCVG